jgi:hypothetical protein
MAVLAAATSRHAPGRARSPRLDTPNPSARRVPGPGAAGDLDTCPRPCRPAEAAEPQRGRRAPAMPRSSTRARHSAPLGAAPR